MILTDVFFIFSVYDRSYYRSKNKTNTISDHGAYCIISFINGFIFLTAAEIYIIITENFLSLKESIILVLGYFLPSYYDTFFNIEFKDYFKKNIIDRFKHCINNILEYLRDETILTKLLALIVFPLVIIFYFIDYISTLIDIFSFLIEKYI